MKFFHSETTNMDDFQASAGQLGKFIQKSWSNLWPTQKYYLHDTGYT